MKKRLRILQEAYVTERMVRIKRASAPDEDCDGFIVGMSDAFVLLHVTDGGHFLGLSGYSALPMEEIQQVRLLDDHDRFTERALALKGIAPISQPDILLADFPGLISSVNSHFPLFTLHLERLRPDTCYIGRAVTVKKRSVVLREIKPNAQWRTDTWKYRYKHITRVDFGSGYEAALWIVAEADRQTANEIP